MLWTLLCSPLELLEEKGYSNSLLLAQQRAASWTSGLLGSISQECSSGTQLTAPTVVPIRGHLDLIDRIMKGDYDISRSKAMGLGPEQVLQRTMAITKLQEKFASQFDCTVRSSLGVPL